MHPSNDLPVTLSGASPRAVFFDLDGTLLDYGDQAWSSTVQEVCASLARTVTGIDPVALRRSYVEVCSEYWSGASGPVVSAPGVSRSGYQIWREHWEAALRQCGSQEAGAAGEAVRCYLSGRHRRYRLYGDVTGVLAELRAQVDHLVLITNGPDDTQRDKLAVTGLDRRFDLVLTSGEVGFAKPDPRIFERALQELGLDRRSVWHVGDSVSHDVTGARNAGLAAGVWLNRTVPDREDAEPRRWWEIASLSELPALWERAAGPDRDRGRWA